MKSMKVVLFTLFLLGLFSSSAMAEENAKPQVLEVSEKFWPPSSNSHMIYAMNVLNPFMPERRWIPYADGLQVSEIEFHEIAGLDEEVKRLKARQKRAWTGVAAGAVAVVGSTALLSMHVLSEDESARLSPAGMGGTIALGFAGMGAYMVGVHGVWFRGTKRKQAYKIAEEHNQQR